MVVGGVPVGGAQPDPADEIAKLADLRDRGALTEAEFEAQKKKVLGTRFPPARIRHTGSPPTRFTALGRATTDPNLGVVPLGSTLRPT